MLLRSIALVKTAARREELQPGITLYFVWNDLNVLGTMTPLHQLQGKFLPLFARPLSPNYHCCPTHTV
jgi:hypothetical protein